MDSCYSGDSIAGHHKHTDIITFNTEEPQQSRGKSGGAMVLDKLPVPGRPTYLE